MYQDVDMFISAVKLGILTWGSIETDSLLEPASSGQLLALPHWLHFSAPGVASWFSQTEWAQGITEEHRVPPHRPPS